ncbi:hypothetical protein P3T76_010123 [Phytophthora citrophthora]|uniref:Uncharacterized protein n=1 Tax=Phytophthora citrophthora TaxID=4793 RepID=A0AAD9GE02_9STRA|nr:hypothetical protein P3T76_010123 [Phytophthora citrophthora]
MLPARRRRSEWPESVRQDPEIKELDEEKGEWVLCRTCAENYERTQSGRKPNDPRGFKVKMNGKFQEAAWVMHKSRVVAHRDTSEMATAALEERRREIELEFETQQILPKRPRVAGEEEDGEPLESGDEGVEREHSTAKLVHLPTTGWRCPGIVPDAFYRQNVELVHAFAKYYVGTYRVNVVRDLRSDKMMLFSHDCENEVVHRGRAGQADSCERCYSVWMHNKSFKRILKKMDRYTLVEDILRHSWRYRRLQLCSHYCSWSFLSFLLSITPEELSVLSKFKHSSDTNLNLEGRRLKQAAMAVVQHFSGSIKSASTRNRAERTSTNTARSDRFDRVQQPLSMEEMLQLQSFDSSMHDEGSETLPAPDGHLQPPSLNGYLIQPNTTVTHEVERVPSPQDE